VQRVRQARSHGNVDVPVELLRVMCLVLRQQPACSGSARTTRTGAENLSSGLGSSERRSAADLVSMLSSRITGSCVTQAGCEFARSIGVRTPKTSGAARSLPSRPSRGTLMSSSVTALPPTMLARGCQGPPGDDDLVVLICLGRLADDGSSR
jgi:hypothetical protein